MGLLRTRTSYPRFRREGVAPRIKLTADDVSVLRYVYRHRFVRSADLYRLFAERSQDNFSRRLMYLFRNEFLDRPRAQVNRYDERGTLPYVYALGKAGARYLKDTFGIETGTMDWRRRNREHERENLDHTLAISHFLIDLELACRSRGDLSFLPFDEILVAGPEDTRTSPSPGKWSAPLLHKGARSSVNVEPDAIFGLRITSAGEGPRHVYFFLEIDLGSMTIAPVERVRESDAFRYRATILRKLLTYAESHRQDLHKKRFGIPAARVLTLTTSEARAEAMRQAAEMFVIRPLKLPPGLFLFGVQSAGDPLAAEFKDSAGRSVRLLPQAVATNLT